MDKLLKDAGLSALVTEDDYADEHESPAFGRATGETRVYNWESMAKAATKFIEAQELTADTLEELVKVRKQRAEERILVLAALDDILAGCMRNTSALPDLLTHIALALKGSPSKTSNVCHYAHDLSVLSP